MDTVIKSTRKREQFYPSEENQKWLSDMELKGVNKSSLINLALDILKPRTGNIKSSDVLIQQVIEEKRLSILKFESEIEY